MEYDGDMIISVIADGETDDSHQYDDVIQDTVLDGDIESEAVIDGEEESRKEYDGEMGVAFHIGGSGIPYTGETTVTPTRETQVLHTAGFSLDRNIIVDPIPENYGLITWNGHTLTVS